MKTLNDYKWICPAPFVDIHVHNTGEMKPCCVMDYSEQINEFKNIQNDSFYDYYNAESTKRLRDGMRNENDDEYVYGICEKCKQVEDLGNKSYRQIYIETFDKKEELEKIIAEDIQPTFFNKFEFKPLVSNKCNLACNMCHSDWSSRYHAEAITLGEIEKKNTIISPDINDKAWNELPDILSKLEEIKIVGGEPLFAEGTYKLIEMVPHPEKMKLKTITNGTIDPTRFIELTKDFKSVKINISIEGTPKLTEYIRWPSKWVEIEKNYDKLKHHSKIKFVSTINALNISNAPELKEFMEKKYYNHIQNILVVNNEYSLSSIPPDIKDKYLNKLYSNKMIDLIKYLEQAEYNEDDMWKMLNHIKRRDNHRKTNLLNVLPEWKKYYENCSG